LPRAADAGDNISPVTRPALTSLSEDESLFRDSVYEFADREIRPLVREMDEHAKIPRALIDKLFSLDIGRIVDTSDTITIVNTR